ncbi:MAG: sigma-70 family RNA polymerase sigma factor [Reichenbachiella sp.]|uniref:RNA polymerase sigma factor n=1 Tax=Reichenbachiella sp. TaxID=2184521 RepID=UPI00329789AF
MKTNQTEQLKSDLLSRDPLLRSEALETIYKVSFSTVKHFILNNTGSVEDAKDVFQDGTMVLFQNILNDKFNSESSLKSYLFGICKNLWMNHLRKQKNLPADFLNEDGLMIIENNEHVIDVEAVKSIMEELKEECQDILKGFYYNMKSMKELALKFGLASEQAAKNKKSRCLKYLTKLIQDRKMTHEDFVI